MIAQEVLNATQQDIQHMVGMNHASLLDYVGRVQLFIHKRSRFNFMLSCPQKFITEKGQTDYWIGPSGQGPINVVDTGLNLQDVEFIKPGSVFDESNMKILGRVTERPAVQRLQFPDYAQRLGKPSVWRFDSGGGGGTCNVACPGNVMNLYPAPDNQNGYSPVPEAPYVSPTASGALAARTYSVRITLVDSLGGESIAPNQAFVYLPANQVAVVHPPNPTVINGASGVAYDRYNVYAIQTTNQGGGGEIKQTPSPISITTSWQEPGSGLISSGAGVPNSSSIAQLGGYIIQFRYFRQRQTKPTLATVLQIPDEYFDTMVAGVNWLAFSQRADLPYAVAQTALWKQNFEELLTAMIRDKFMFPKGGDYMSPDPTAIAYIQPGVETVELANLLNI